MVRDTSREAWRLINEHKLLNPRRIEIYNTLFEMKEAATANEILMEMGETKHQNQSNIGTRLGEMRESGVVREAGKKICKVTNMKVLTWEVTSSIPQRAAPTIREKIKANERKIKKLEEKNKELIARIQGELKW